MKNRYDRAIERVEVTAEMRERIMSNISGASANKQAKPAFRHYRKYISIAACFIILLIGAFVVYSSLNDKGPGPVGTGGIVDCGSLDELSGAVGFTVREVKILPFNVEQTAYTSFFGTTAQIKYMGGGSELAFRMSAGSDDNSGDYGEYSDIKSASAGGLNVTLKGNGGLYNLALWQDGGYSYSIRITIGDSGAGVTEEEILGAVVSVG